MALIPKLLDRVLKMSWWTSTRASNESIGGIWRFLGGIYTEHIRDTTTANRIIARFQTIANAVNYITTRNAATNNNPVITTANSSNTHVGLDIQLKGDGRVKLLGNQYTPSQSAEKLVSLNNNEIRAEYNLVSGSVLADIPDDHGVRLDDDEAWLIDLYDFETCERQGYKGGISSDETYYYVCIEDNTWIRIMLTNSEGDVSFPEITGDPMDNTALAAVLNLKLGEVKPADLNIAIVNSTLRVPLIQSGDFQSNGVRLEINPVGLAIPRFDINGRLYTNEAALDTQIPNLGQLNTLLSVKSDLVDGKIPVSQLPSYVSDVIVVGDYSLLPAIGEESKIYVTEDENKTYRWTGSAYVEIGDGGVALGETSATAYRGDRGKTAYDHSQTSGNPHNTEIDDIEDLRDELDNKLSTVIPSDLGITDTGTNRVPYGRNAVGWGMGLRVYNTPFSDAIAQYSSGGVLKSTQGNASNDVVTIGKLTTELAGKADTVHSHIVSDITGLEDELDLKLESVTPADLNCPIDNAENRIPYFVQGAWVNNGVRYVSNSAIGNTLLQRDGDGRVYFNAAVIENQGVNLGQMTEYVTDQINTIPAIQYTDDSNSNYKLIRTIVGSKIMLEVDIFIVEDLATDISFELIPLDLARFFYFQSIVQVASTTGWTLGANGTGASELTVSFNKLLDEANPETFAMKGRQGGSPPDLEGLYGASQYILNSVSRGSMNTSYDSNRRLVKLYTAAVNMTLNTSQTREMEIGYKLVIEGTLLF